MKYGLAWCDVDIFVVVLDDVDVGRKMKTRHMTASAKVLMISTETHRFKLASGSLATSMCNLTSVVCFEMKVMGYGQNTWVVANRL